MNEESHNPDIDPELEVRIVALLLGEASDFERDELDRLIEQRPELATLKEQIQSVHGLLRDVGAGESVAEDDDWKLPAEKRHKVLATISGEVQERPTIPFVAESADKRRGVQRSWLSNLTKIAAVFCAIGFFAAMAMPAIVARRLASSSSRFKQLGLATMNDAREATDSVDRLDRRWGGTRLRDANELEKSKAVIADDLAETIADAASGYRLDPKQSLSGIRDSLEGDAAVPSTDYLREHTQTFSGELDVLSYGESGSRRRFGGGYGGGLGGGSAALNDERSQPVPAERQQKGVARQESSVGRANGQMEAMPPAEPMVAGAGIGISKQANEYFDAARVARPIPSPTNGPMPLGEELKHKGAAVSAGDREEISKESVIVPSFDGLAFNRRPIDFRNENGRAVSRMADPISGAARSQPRGEVPFEDAKQDTRWDDAPFDPPAATTAMGDDLQEIESRAKGSLGKYSDFSTLYEGMVTASDALPSGNEKKVNADPGRLPNVYRHEMVELRQQLGQSSIADQDHWFGMAPHLVEGDSDSTTKTPAKKPAAPAALDETDAAEEAFSTFSLHVSDVSFKLAQSALAHGQWPEVANIRVEEFVNAFDYGDPLPGQREKVACRMEQAIHPFLQQRNLLRVSIRTGAAGRSSNTPLRLTFLLDNSGSMERIDRRQTVRRAFALLTQQLTPIDQVTLISFARQPRLLADKVSGSQSNQLVGLFEALPSEGGTNIEAALQLAFEKAREQQADDAQNRIILLTDGAVNLGDADPRSLSRMILTMRDAGIAFDAAGISAEGLNDEVLEALTRKGDGRYYLLDSLEAADEGFARQIAGALRPSAKNVKVQVEFNPKRVGRYKLLGYEKHRLNQEDFRNDTVDAAEMAAAEAGVAVYQFEAKPDGEGDVGSVSVRFRDLSTGQMIENRWPIPYQADAPRLDQAAPSIRVATTAALLAAKLRGEPLGESVDLKALANLISGLPERDRDARRVQQLQLMIGQARQVSGQ